jgi:hypothetical protein
MPAGRSLCLLVSFNLEERGPFSQQGPQHRLGATPSGTGTTLSGSSPLAFLPSLGIVTPVLAELGDRGKGLAPPHFWSEPCANPSSLGFPSLSSQRCPHFPACPVSLHGILSGEGTRTRRAPWFLATRVATELLLPTTSPSAGSGGSVRSGWWGTGMSHPPPRSWLCGCAVGGAAPAQGPVPCTPRGATGRVGVSSAPRKKRGGERGDDFGRGKALAPLPAAGVGAGDAPPPARRRPQSRLALARGASSARTRSVSGCPESSPHPGRDRASAPPARDRFPSPRIRGAGSGAAAAAAARGPSPCGEEGARVRARAAGAAQAGRRGRSAAAHSPSPPSSSSHEYQMPVWKFLKRKRSSPVSQL